MLHETLPLLHRTAAALTLVAANYAAAFAQGNWIILVRRLVFHCQNLHSSRIVAEFFRARALRRRLIERHGVREEEKKKRKPSFAHQQHSASMEAAFEQEHGRTTPELAAGMETVPDGGPRHAQILTSWHPTLTP